MLLAEIGDRFASLSPDDKKIVFNRRGDPHREAYRGSTAGELWEIDIETKSYARLTFTNQSAIRGIPRATGSTIAPRTASAFKSTAPTAWTFPSPGSSTNFRWSARDINVARQNDRMAFEMFDEIWTWEPQRGAGKAGTEDK